jgi:predicted ATP-grasp superfamily ATP-dependent carboligase
LVVGFNTRPLCYSLKKAGYTVYTVDFFGDLDLYPNVEDYIIITKELHTSYNSINTKISKSLMEYALKLYQKYQNVTFLLIGSGLDDAYEERKLILEEIGNSDTTSVNNDLEVIKKSRDIDNIFKFLQNQGYNIPNYCTFEKFKSGESSIKYPFILKKKRSAGGMNVYKIKDNIDLAFQIKILKTLYVPSDWIIQEYIEGIPISCTLISDGNECEIISINQQIIGEEFLNSPKKFMYCGNIVPAKLLENEEELISEISIKLSKQLGLKGINGFDFVLRDRYPYFMECNPRIPGSIRASEVALNLNLLDLHIRSFIPNEWESIKKSIKLAFPRTAATKFVYFAPKDIDKDVLLKINDLKYIHDKSEPFNDILKGEPLCTILYEGKDGLKSYNGALKVINQINRIINKITFPNHATGV